MTMFVYVGGVEVSGRIRIEDGIQTMTQAADGDVGSSILKLDDPDGDLSIAQWSYVVINETDCTPPRCFTGYVYKVHYERGPFLTSDGRVIVLDVVDLNTLLHQTILRAGTSNRPLESGTARLTWLLGSAALSGIVYDRGLVGSNPWMFDESNYVKAYANDVLPDLCVSSSGEVGRIYFVYWDHATGTPGLFYDRPTAAVSDSTLSLSNVHADINETTTFWAYVSPEEDREGDGLYCGVLFGWKGGYIYRHRQSTHDALGLGFHREGLFETDRIGNVDTADRHAEQWLDTHSAQKDTVTCVVRLPAAKVNLIEAGHRIQVRFNHLPGFETTTWTRVSRRSFMFTPGTNQFYDVQLELSTKPIVGAGGGNPGGFPLGDPAPPALEQFVHHATHTGGTSVTLPAAPTEGDLLVLWRTRRGGVDITVTPPGWTAHPLAGISPSSDSAAMFYRIVAAGETTTISVRDSSDTGPVEEITVAEFSGVDTTADANSEQSNNSTTVPATVNAGTITPTSGQSVLLVEGLCVACSDFPSDVHSFITPDAAWTEVVDTMTNQSGSGANFQPLHWFGYRVVTLASGSYATAQGLGGGTLNYTGDGGQALAFAASAQAIGPLTGQVVLGEVASMAGAVGTLDYPYASILKVRVDGVIISPASYTETNPGAGTFTLAWVPATDETVTVDYQGI